MRTRTGDATFCRITLLAPRSRVDVALPADVPLAELVPLVLELLGEPRPPHPLAAWHLSGATGGPLPASATLGGLGVLDGELLRIGPQVAVPPAPVFDDPVDMLAATARGDAAAGPRLRAGGAVAAAVLAGALIALVGSPEVVSMVLAALLGTVGAAVCLAHVAGTARSAHPRGTREVAAMCAVAFAGGAGWAAVPGPPGSGQLLVAAVAAGTAAAVGQLLIRVVAPVLVAAVVVAAALTGVALARLWLGAEAVALAAGAAALAVAVEPLLPRAALRLAGLPRPSIPVDAGELVAPDGLDRLPSDELIDRAGLARGLLTGLVGGMAAIAAVAAPMVAAAGGWAGPVCAIVNVLVIALRVRGFADAAPARATLVAALVAAAGTAVVLATVGGPVTRLVVAAVVGAGAVAATLLAGRAGPIASPVSRRAVDLLEGVLTAAAIPLALAVMDVYAMVRGW